MIYFRVQRRNTSLTCHTITLFRLLTKSKQSTHIKTVSSLTQLFTTTTKERNQAEMIIHQFHLAETEVHQGKGIYIIKLDAERHWAGLQENTGLPYRR